MTIALTLPKQWALGLLCSLGIFTTPPAVAQDVNPNPTQPVVSAISASPDFMAIVLAGAPEGAYEIVIEEDGTKTATGMALDTDVPGPGSHHARLWLIDHLGAPLDPTGRRLGPSQVDPRRGLKVGTRFWLRRVGADPAEDIGDGQGGPCVIKDDPRVARTLWLARGLLDFIADSDLPQSPPGQYRIDPRMYELEQPKVWKNRYGTGSPGPMLWQTGYEAGTRIIFELDELEASWTGHPHIVGGSGVEISHDGQVLEVRFTEDWDLLESRQFSIVGLGLIVHRVSWVRVHRRIIGDFDTLVTDDNSAIMLSERNQIDVEHVGHEVVRVRDVGNRGDINGDRRVDIDDLVPLLYAWGAQCPDGCPEDTNEDQEIDIRDLLIMLDNYNPR